MRHAQWLVQVVGVYRGANPREEAASFQDDLILADLQIVTNRLERLRTNILKPRPDRDELRAELACLEPLAAILGDGKSLRGVKFTEAQENATRSFSLLTSTVMHS